MRSINKAEYPFAWLDEVVEVTLNPSVTKVEDLAAKDLENLSSHLTEETRRVENGLKARTFSLKCKAEIQTVAEQYYVTARQLLSQALVNLNAYAQNKRLLKVGLEVKSVLEASCERMRSRYQHYLPESLAAELNMTGVPEILFKLLIRLSGDQIGILIRAAYEGKLIDAPSKRAAYKALAPFLSTPNKEDLSEDSLRSNAGRPEARDREILIGVLMKLIEIIRDYR